jgi:hypothetical protein
MNIMKRLEGTNTFQKFCSFCGKFLQCSSQDGIDFISFVMSRASTGTSSEAGICSKNGVGAKAGIDLDAGTDSDAGIGSKAGTGVKARTGSDARTGLDAGIQENSSSGNPTKTIYPVIMDNITIPLITIFSLFF